MRGWAGLAVLALSMGCARENPLFSESGTESGTFAATSSTSAGSGDGSTVTDASAGPVTTTTETGQHEDSGTAETADSDETSTSSDGGRSCAFAVDDDIVAHYRFDDPNEPWFDGVGGYDGISVGGRPQSVPGPDGCGSALGITPRSAGRVEDAPAFDLTIGSVDFWVFVPGGRISPVINPLDATPLLSRDAAGADSEHLTFFVSDVDRVGLGTSTGHLVIRHQSMGSAAAVCSKGPLPTDVWVHVAYNFGTPGMQLFIDGVVQTIAARPIVPGEIPTCDGIRDDDDTLLVGGLQTDLPWYIGASANDSNKNEQNPTSYMQVGALDEIRISSVRRDFSAL